MGQTYSQAGNFHFSNTNFPSPRMIGKLWSRCQGVKYFAQDFLSEKRLEKINCFTAKTLRK